MAETLAAVIQLEPDWSALPPALSPRVRELLKRCLEKDPAQRRRDIGDVRVELERIASSEDEPAVAVPAAVPGWRRSALLALATLVAGVLIGIAVSRAPEPEKPVMRFEIPLPDGARFSGTGRRMVAISSDGRRLAHTAFTDQDSIYLRDLDAMSSVSIAETVGFDVTAPHNPAFSSDGEWVLFSAAGELKKVAVHGGAPVTLSDVTSPDGARWREDDTIVYADGNRIWRVPANGGEPEPLVTAEDGARLHRPQLLPGGRAILYSYTATEWEDTQVTEPEIVVQPFHDGERRVLFRGASAQYVPTGHLVYALENTLFAIAFDADSLEVSGGPVPVVDGVARAEFGNVASQFDVADVGTLIYVPGSGTGWSEIVWRGAASGSALTARPGEYRSVRLSPDGERLAAEVYGPEGRDIWIHDVARGTATRLTTGGRSRRPVWAPNGEWVAFYSSGTSETTRGLFRRRADFGGEAELVFESSQMVGLDDWSPDGRWLLYSSGRTETGRNLLALDLEGDGEPRPVVQSRFFDTTGAFSPDGRFLLYHSNESGRFEVYVTSFPESGRKIQLSTDGGVDGVWSPEGDRIVYVDPAGTFYEVEVTTVPELTASAPREIFRANYRDNFGRGYDVHPDGERFVVVTGAGGMDSIVVVVNWLEELKRLVPIDD